MQEKSIANALLKVIYYVKTIAFIKTTCYIYYGTSLRD